MSLDWMGKYRSFVEAMVRYGNAYAQAVNVPGIFEGTKITSTQLQVLEYLYENEDRNDNLSRIAERLQISLGTLSRNVKQLEQFGFLEKYRKNGNMKEVIIKVSDSAKKMYEEYSIGPRTAVWRESFKCLDAMDASQVEEFVRLLDMHSEYLYKGIGRLDEVKEDVLQKIE